MKLINIEILRIISALAVVAQHTEKYVSSLFGNKVVGYAFFTQGGFGVDLFFVISGFVVGLSQLTNPRLMLSFIRVRLTRIVPAYWTITLLTALMVSVANFLGRKLDAYPEGVDLGWAFASSLFLSQAVLGEWPLLFVGWTLEYEIFFYGCVALGILLFAKIERQLLFSAFLVGMVVVFWSPEFSARSLGFPVGILAALIHSRTVASPSMKRLSFPLLLSGLALLGTQALLVGADDPQWLVIALSFGLIVLGSSLLPNLNWSWCGTLGKASYSVYLVQSLSIPVFSSILYNVFAWNNQVDLFFWVIMATTLIIGILFEKYFNSPVSRWLGHRLSGI